MTSRGTSVEFGYIVRGGGANGNNVKARLKGNIYTVDEDLNGTADFVRAEALNMPQALWNTGVIDFETPMIKNPVDSCGPTAGTAVSTQITGWSGASESLSNPVEFEGCDTDDVDPVVTITSPANGATVSSATLPVAFTATDDTGVTSCTRNGAADSCHLAVQLHPDGWLPTRSPSPAATLPVTPEAPPSRSPTCRRMSLRRRFRASLRQTDRRRPPLPSRCPGPRLTQSA